MKRVIISRVDNIGDVVLTIPIAGFIKQHFPQAQIWFIGKKYTKAVIESSENIDNFIDFDYLSSVSKTKAVKLLRNIKADTIIHVFPNSKLSYLSFRAGIPNRIGTSRRWHHKLFLNKTLNISRRKSELHEAQLNLLLLQNAIPNFQLPELSEIPEFYNYQNINPIPERLVHVIEKNRLNVILHPKSKGSAREWGLDNFSQLIRKADLNKYHFIICGTKEEAAQMEGFLNFFSKTTTNLTGQLNLSEYISLINSCDALIAASTGPLHIAAACGIRAIGIYAPMKPIYPTRWAPLGKKATFLVKDATCNDCKKNENCHCIRSISPEMVLEKL